MAALSQLPAAQALAFIRGHVGEGKLLWTYHAHMRLSTRGIGRAEVLAAAPGFELVEAYPDDKYLPSYLVLGPGPIHVLFAVDVEGDNVRVVTAYRPDASEWGPDLKTRRGKP